MNIDWSTGLQGLVLGLGAVFLILILLIAFISLMGVLVQKSEKKKTTQPNATQIAKAVASPQDDEDEIIAAITAAIACMAQREGKKFKIRSFRRV